MADADNIPGAAVVDASYILAFLLPDEHIDRVDRVFDAYQEGKISLVSTLLLPFEVFNGLASAVKQKRLTQKSAVKLGQGFLELSIAFEPINYVDALELALNNKLSVYDGAYLLLAQQNRLKLLTCDDRLLRGS